MCVSVFRVSKDRTLRPYFRTPKPKQIRWLKRKHARGNRNFILSLLAPKNGTIRGLARKTGLSERCVAAVLRGHTGPSFQSARLLARALGVSMETLADVLEVYAPKRERKPKQDS